MIMLLARSSRCTHHLSLSLSLLCANALGTPFCPDNHPDPYLLSEEEESVPERRHTPCRFVCNLPVPLCNHFVVD